MITLHFHLQPQYKYELFHINFTSFHCTGRYELNKLTSLPMCGFIAQLVEHRTGIVEVTGSNPVEALIFFRLLLSNCLNWKIYCDDHSSLSYLSFCAYCGYQPLPAAGSTLNRYPAFLARSLSASSIQAYLNAIRILHLEHGLNDPTKNNFHLATTLRGIRRTKGLTVSQKKPITPQILLALKNQLNWDDPWHARF